MEVIAMIPEQYIPKHRPHVCAILKELLTSKALRVGLFIDWSIVEERILLSTTMGLKYPLKKFDSHWPFPMGIWNDFINIFGKDCHIWNNAPRSLKCQARAQVRSVYVKIPRLFTVYLSMGRGRNRFLNLCARVWYFLHSWTEFSWKFCPRVLEISFLSTRVQEPLYLGCNQDIALNLSKRVYATIP